MCVIPGQTQSLCCLRIPKRLINHPVLGLAVIADFSVCTPLFVLFSIFEPTKFILFFSLHLANLTSAQQSKVPHVSVTLTEHACHSLPGCSFISAFANPLSCFCNSLSLWFLSVSLISLPFLLSLSSSAPLHPCDLPKPPPFCRASYWERYAPVISLVSLVSKEELREGA